MADKALDLSTIGQLEKGYFELMVNDAIRRAMRDCKERPYLDKARTVNIQLEFTPNPPQENTRSMTVHVAGKVKDTAPPRLTTGEFLDVVEGADSNGEPEVKAVYAMTPLFERTN